MTRLSGKRQVAMKVNRVFPFSGFTPPTADFF